MLLYHQTHILDRIHKHLFVRINFSHFILFNMLIKFIIIFERLFDCAKFNNQLFDSCYIQLICQKSKSMQGLTYEQISKSIQESQAKSKATLERIQNTLKGVRTTLDDISQTNANIDRVKEEFNTVMDKLAVKISNSFNPQISFKKQQRSIYDLYPKQGQISEAVQSMLSYNEVLILTGAGVSAPSGIPTFRGQSGLYSKKFQFQGIQYEPQQFITKQFYQKHPEPIWNWIQYINSLAMTCQPNKIHHQIDQLAKALTLKGKKVVIATQNIDDLHIKPLNLLYEYYSIHGNCKQVRCDNYHFKEYSKNARNQKCDICSSKFRPHVLFFDESYGPFYGQQIQKRQFDFVMVIGTSLKTGLCIRKVSEAKQIVQINPCPQIQIGNVHQFTKQAEKVLSQINHQLQKSQKSFK